MLNQKKYHQLIETVLCTHNIDSYQVERITAKNFSARMQQAAGTKAINFAASMMWKTLKKEVKSLGATLQWKHLVNAVRHEMNNQIADKVAEVAPTLGPMDKSSGDALTYAISSKTERTLTEPEAKYLRFLMVRAMDKITLRAPPMQSLVSRNDNYTSSCI